MSGHAYIGRKSCGCLVMAVIDDPAWKSATAEEVADAIRGGLTIERVTADEARAMKWGCDCQKRLVFRKEADE